MKQKLLTSVLLATVSCSANAAITILASDSASAISGGGGNGQTFSNFDPSGGSKLVVTIAAEGNGGARTINSVSFGGTVMTPAVFTSDGTLGLQSTAIYYLDNPSNIAGDIVVDWSGNVNGVGFGVLSLDGAALGAPEAIAGVDGTTVPITSLTDGGLLVATFAANGGAAPGGSAPLTELLSSGDIGSAVAGAGYQDLPTAGLQNPAFTSGNSRPVVSAAVFATVPEPSTALLGVIGTVGLLRRRR